MCYLHFVSILLSVNLIKWWRTRSKNLGEAYVSGLEGMRLCENQITYGYFGRAYSAR